MDSYSWCCGHHPVGEDKQIEANKLEDVLEKPNDLQGEHVLQEHNRKQIQVPLLKHHSCEARHHRLYLPAVVSNFKDGRLPANPA